MLTVFVLFTLVLSLRTCNNPFCTSCSNNSSVCTECLGEFILQNGMCVFGLSTCEQFNDYEWSTGCTTCSLGYMLKNGICSKCDANPHCLTFEGNCNTCGECIPQFYLKNGICTSDDFNCEEYNESGVCLSCTSGYYLDATKKCVLGTVENCDYYNSEGKCLYCLDSFVTDVTTKKCVKEIDVKPTNCELMIRTDYCISCVNGYYWDKQILECRRCEDGCAQCDDKDSCSVCENGYGKDLSSGGCFKCSDGCNKCMKFGSGEVECVECYNNYYLNNYTCTNCTQWNSMNECIECFQGYTVDPQNKEACINSNPICSTYDTLVGTTENITVCVDCMYGYFLNTEYQCEKCDDVCDGKCTYKANMCDVYQCDNTLCTSCPNGGATCDICLDEYSAEDNSCGPNICTSMRYDGVCSVCTYQSDDETYSYLPDSQTGHCKSNKKVEQKKGSKGGIIAAVIIGLLALVVIIAILCCSAVYIYRKKRKTANKDDTKIMETELLPNIKTNEEF
ncbi:hypothetical protein EIN_135960 [Entamoeba invadens IP1]|uniref:EGF-like domain-containing protein n=1 Tax=Entamoeba invadens IP1 TaxID=370355 RepID=A0A0A1TXE9_ENTIV|nr:hypothetical protein EIN_135960 [Entamoeba invadens IP1]ELP85962.1 hypothetical protein EIN_135960 [Entamoeba invadens IP1]|eukprot:XP_004185308.1 hypothetical protein EIN_135960 [Entamoeba invadens IP1]